MSTLKEKLIYDVVRPCGPIEKMPRRGRWSGGQNRILNTLRIA